MFFGSGQDMSVRDELEGLDEVKEGLREIIANQGGVFRIKGHLPSRPLCSHSTSSEHARPVVIVLPLLRDVAASPHPDPYQGGE